MDSIVLTQKSRLNVDTNSNLNSASDHMIQLETDIKRILDNKHDYSSQGFTAQSIAAGTANINKLLRVI